MTLVNTMSNERWTKPGSKASSACRRERIVDYLALIGDAVDNVPGVEKVGPKTAVKWLTQYGTLDNVVAHADEIGGAVGENLRQGAGLAAAGAQLLTVKCDLELPWHHDDLAPRAPDRQAGTATLGFQRFEFKSWAGAGERSGAGRRGAAIAPTRRGQAAA